MCPDTEKRPPADPAAYILACHDGDPLAAIGAMLEEIEHLQDQLNIAVAVMGRGYTRGWVPNAERSAEQ